MQGIEIYEFLKILSENNNAKHNLKMIVIEAFDSFKNHNIKSILKAKSLGFNRCKLKYDGEDEHYLELFSPWITNQDLKFIKLNVIISYAVHQVALKSGWYSKWFDEFEFINSRDEIEIISWINSLQILDQMSFEQFENFWSDLGYKNSILWCYLCWILMYFSKITDINFPTDLVRTGFIKFRVQNSVPMLENSISYYPFVITESILSNKQDIPFPPSYYWFLNDWPNKLSERNDIEFLMYLYNEKGYSKEYLLINANYNEYENFGLEGFAIISAVIHFLENSPFMSKQVQRINHSLPI